MRFLYKSRKCLRNAREILAIGLGDESGRGAYLAGFHAARAFIFETTGKVAKSHNGVQTLFYEIARNNPSIPSDFLSFLSHAYHLKAVANYETGEGSSVPVEKAAKAIETASRFIDCIEKILADMHDISSVSAEID
ncbi:MAG: HEPN domain-containing protein [Desulfuromonadaceae bacterium]